ncbi:MAG: hypothetical protein JWM68_1279 [Verrucomicrobiales bacterium]|nr:hypothetical protein [Verrucomicrobiales bacterium]
MDQKSVCQMPKNRFSAKKRFSGNRKSGFWLKIEVPGVGKAVLDKKSFFREAKRHLLDEFWHRDDFTDDKCDIPDRNQLTSGESGGSAHLQP